MKQLSGERMVQSYVQLDRELKPTKCSGGKRSTNKKNGRTVLLVAPSFTACSSSRRTIKAHPSEYIPKINVFSIFFPHAKG